MPKTATGSIADMGMVGYLCQLWHRGSVSQQFGALADIDIAPKQGSFGDHSGQ